MTKKSYKPIKWRVRSSRKKPKPRPIPFKFKNPENTPRGARYNTYRNGIIASVPAHHRFIGLLFAAGASFLGYIFFHAGPHFWDSTCSYHNHGNKNGIWMFYLLMGFGTLFMLILSLYYLFGRISFKVRGKTFFYVKGVLGIGLRIRMPLLSIHKIGTKKRKTVLADWDEIGGESSNLSVVRDMVLFVEGDMYFTTASNIKPIHLYYLRYVLREWVRRANRQAKRSKV